MGVPATERVDAEDIRVSKNFVRLDFWMQTRDMEKIELVKSYLWWNDDGVDLELIAEKGDAERFWCLSKNSLKAPIVQSERDGNNSIRDWTSWR